MARLSGLSRAGISAIETGRLVPSAAAALALGEAFGCRVEDLFQLRRSASARTEWAWAPRHESSRYWRAEVGGKIRLYPIEATPLGIVPHDGVIVDGSMRDESGEDPARTLVIACCDPAVGLLATELARAAGLRLVVVPRSSRKALDLLGRGLVHAAGVHLARAEDPDGNAKPVGQAIGGGFALLRVSAWEEGIAFSPGLHLPTVRDATKMDLRWVGREDGSGARQCLDEILGGKPILPTLASDHRGVAEAVRSGWADAGICLRLIGEEAGLDFLRVRQEAYDLCLPARWKNEPRLKALVAAVRSAPYRRALGQLPGYDCGGSGELTRVD
ncbi:substrate-binding domain-containing protein [Singulisphaera sp. PoT]|uniref:substrate-binding domain-containing protein n=1 Tax=Singulisphaera sp. PoT TaxID=3411797 RepID=UPI003BF53FA0